MLRVKQAIGAGLKGNHADNTGTFSRTYIVSDRFDLVLHVDQVHIAESAPVASYHFLQNRKLSLVVVRVNRSYWCTPELNIYGRSVPMILLILD